MITSGKAGPSESRKPSVRLVELWSRTTSDGEIPKIVPSNQRSASCDRTFWKL